MGRPKINFELTALRLNVTSHSATPRALKSQVINISLKYYIHLLEWSSGEHQHPFFPTWYWPKTPHNMYVVKWLIDFLTIYMVLTTYKRLHILWCHPQILLARWDSFIAICTWPPRNQRHRSCLSLPSLVFFCYALSLSDWLPKKKKTAFRNATHSGSTLQYSTAYRSIQSYRSHEQRHLKLNRQHVCSI